MRLVTAALGGGFILGVGLLELGGRHAWGHRGWMALIVGVVIAGAMAVLIHFVAKRDTAANAREVDEWVRDNRLPSHVPLGEALSRFATRIDQVRTAVWSNGGFLLLSLSQLALLPDQPTLLGIGVRVAVCTVFAVALGWAVHVRIRRVPVMRELILEGQRRFAGIASPAD